MAHLPVERTLAGYDPGMHVPEDAQAGVGRRQLLKAGAWAAPVVVLAAAVPAASASPQGQGQIGFTNITGWIVTAGPNLTAIAGTTQFQAAWSDDAKTITSATVVITLPAAGMVAAAPTVVAGNSEWTAGTGTISGADAVYEFVWGGSIDPSIPGISTPLEFTLPATGTVADAGFPKTAIAVLTSPQASGDTESGTITAANTVENKATFPIIPPPGHP